MIFGLLLMIKRHLKLYVSDLGLRFTNRSLTSKYKIIYIDRRRQNSFDKLLSGQQINSACKTEFRWGDYFRFVLLGYFGWTSLEGRYKLSLIFRWFANLLTRYELNRRWYHLISVSTQPVWVFWFVLTNRKEIEIEFFKQRMFLNYYTSNLMLNFYGGLFGDYYEEWFRNPINNRKQPIWFYIRWRWHQRWLPFWLFFNPRLVYCRAMLYRLRDYCVLPGGLYRNHHWLVEKFFANRYLNLNTYYVQKQFTSLLGVRLRNLNLWLTYQNKLKKKHLFKRQRVARFLLKIRHRFHQTNNRSFRARIVRRAAKSTYYRTRAYVRQMFTEWKISDLRFLRRGARRRRRIDRKMKKLRKLKFRRLFARRQKFKPFFVQSLISNTVLQRRAVSKDQILTQINPLQFDQIMSDHTLFGDDYLITFDDQQDDDLGAGDEPENENFHYGMMGATDFETTYADYRRHPKITRRLRRRRKTYDRYRKADHLQYLQRARRSHLYADPQWVPTPEENQNLDHQRLLSSGDGPSAVDQEYTDEEVEIKQDDLDYLQDWALLSFSPLTLNEMGTHDGHFNWVFNWNQSLDRRLNLVSRRNLLQNSKQFSNNWYLTSKNMSLKKGGRRYLGSNYKFARMSRNHLLLGFRRRQKYFLARSWAAEFVPLRFKKKTNFKFFQYYTRHRAATYQVYKRTGLKFIPRRIRRRIKTRALASAGWKAWFFDHWKSRHERLIRSRTTRQRTPIRHHLFPRSDITLGENDRHLPTRSVPRRVYFHQYRVNSVLTHRGLYLEQTPNTNFWLVLVGLLAVDDWYTARLDHDLESHPWLTWPWYNLWSWSTVDDGYQELNHGIRLTQYERLPSRIGHQRWRAPQQGWSTFGDGHNTWFTEYRFLHLQSFNYQPEIPYYSPKMSTFLSGRGLTDWYLMPDYRMWYHYYFAPIFPMPNDIRYYLQNNFTHVEEEFFNGAHPLHYKMFYRTYVRTYNMIFHDLMFYYGRWLQTRFDPINFVSTRYAQPVTVGPRLIPSLQVLLGNQMESSLPHFEILGLQHWGYQSRLNLPRSAARYYKFELLQVCSPWEIKLNSALVKNWAQQSQGIENFQPLIVRMGFGQWWVYCRNLVQHLILDDNQFLRLFTLLVVPFYLVTRYKKIYLTGLRSKLEPLLGRVKISQRAGLKAFHPQTSQKLVKKQFHKKFKFRPGYRPDHFYTFTVDEPEDFSLRYIKTEDLPDPAPPRLSSYRVRSTLTRRVRPLLLVVPRYLSTTRYERPYFVGQHTTFKAYKYGTLLQRVRLRPFVVQRPSTIDFGQGLTSGHRVRSRIRVARTLYRAGLVLRLSVPYRRRAPVRQRLVQLLPSTGYYPHWWIKPRVETRTVYPLVSAETKNRSELKRTQSTTNSNLEWYDPYLEDEREIMGERHFFYHEDAEARYLIDRQYRKKIFQGEFGHSYVQPANIPRARIPALVGRQISTKQSSNLITQQSLFHQHLLNNFDHSLAIPQVVTPNRVTLVYNLCDQLRGVKFPGSLHQETTQAYLYVDGDTDYQDQQFYGENGDEDQNQNFILQSDSLFGEYHLEYLYTNGSSLVEVCLDRSSIEARYRQNLTTYRRFGSLSLANYRLSFPMVRLQEGVLGSEFYLGTYSVDHPAYQLLSLTTYHQPIIYRRLTRQPTTFDLGYPQRNSYQYYFAFEKTSLPNPDQNWPRFERTRQTKCCSIFNSDFPVVNPWRVLELENLDYALATYEYLNQLQTLAVDLTRDAPYVLTDQEVQTFTPLGEAYNFNLLSFGPSLYLEIVFRPVATGQAYTVVTHPEGLNIGRELVSTCNQPLRESTYLEGLLANYHEGYDLHTYYAELQIDWSYHTDTVDDPDYEEEEDLTELKQYDLPLGVARYPLTSHSSHSLATNQRLMNSHLSTTLDYLMRLKVETRRRLPILNRYRPYRYRRLSKLARQQRRILRLLPKRLQSQTGLITEYESVNHFQAVNVGDLNSVELSDEWLMTNFFTFWSLTEIYYNDTPNGYTTGY